MRGYRIRQLGQDRKWPTPWPQLFGNTLIDTGIFGEVVDTARIRASTSMVLPVSGKRANSTSKYSGLGTYRWMRARWVPSINALTVPSGSRNSWSTEPMTPTSQISFSLGLSTPAFILGGQKNALVLVHGTGKRADGFVAPDKKRRHHVRENNDVPQRQQGKHFGGGSSWFLKNFGILTIVLF
jgi:hypothetical protein